MVFLQAGALCTAGRFTIDPPPPPHCGSQTFAKPPSSLVQEHASMTTSEEHFSSSYPAAHVHGAAVARGRAVDAAEHR